MRLSTLNALSSQRFVTSHRGLSGTNSRQTRNSTQGTTITPSIHRQLSTPPTSTSRWFETKASAYPEKMANWLSDTMRPRRCAGAISEM